MAFLDSKLLLASLFILGVTQDILTKGQITSSTGHIRLCTSLSEKAIRQRRKLCQDAESISMEKIESRGKRDITTKQLQTLTMTKALSSPQKTTQTAVVKYECKDLPADKLKGYEQRNTGLNLSVTFSRDNDNDWWKANVSWRQPIPKGNQGKCVGYRIVWYKHSDDILEPYPCQKLLNENITHYIIDSSKGWTSNEGPILFVAVYALPTKGQENERIKLRKFNTPTTPISEIPKIITPKPSENDSHKETPRSTKTKPQEINSRKAPRSTKPKPQEKNSKKDHHRSKIIVAITVPVLGAIIIAILCLIYGIRNKLKPVIRRTVKAKTNLSFSLKGPIHYISYFPGNNSMVENAIKITNCLRDEKINAVIDKNSVITCGKRIWCEKQFAAADKVIMIVSSDYLKICKINERKEITLKEMTQDYTNVYNEICHIRHELETKPENAGRFVVVLAGTGENNLPWWMKTLKKYDYKNGVLDENIFSVLTKGSYAIEM